MALSHHMFSRERDDRSYIIVNEEISESQLTFFLSARAFPLRPLSTPIFYEKRLSGSEVSG